MDLKLINKTDEKRGLLAIEKIGLAYTAFTTLLIFIFFDKMHDPSSLIVHRCLIILLTGAVWGIYHLRPCRLTILVRIVAQMALLPYWYPDTYEFNRILPNLDHIFAQAEQIVCGCQPSLLFCKAWNSTLWSEMMNFGYVVYFPLIAIVTFYYFLCRYKEFEKVTFVIMCSFFLYYIVYIFLPVTGPQYYFNAIGVGNALHGHFPEIGTYFNHHSEMLPSPGNSNGFFWQMVENSHEAGERPTAAFPSSHVGMSTVLMILAYKGNKKLCLGMLPCYILLCLSTVYIQAHYLIDAVAGFFTAFGAYWLSLKAYAACHLCGRRK